MNNRIINVKDIPESHKEGRRTPTTTKLDTMTTCYRGMGVVYETKGRKKFKIVHVSDANGNIIPKGKIEKTHIWCRDGESEFEMTAHRKDFWFRNGNLCEDYCRKNKINPKHWKRSLEA